MRIMDVVLSLPALVLAIAITSVLGPTFTNAMLAIGLVYAPTFARVARGPTLTVVQVPFIEAARSIGASNWRIIARHVLPNVMAPILVQMTVSFSTAILTEAALSFLGLGTQPPTASWGLMLSAARQYMLIDLDCGAAGLRDRPHRSRVQPAGGWPAGSPGSPDADPLIRRSALRGRSRGARRRIGDPTQGRGASMPRSWPR